jgi:hypothetical protein
MHVSLSRHRPPTRFERLVGRRRATRLRRRAGFAAIGAGVMLLRPRTLWAPALAVMLAVATGTVLVVAVT